MLVTFFRTLIIIITLMVLMRLMGKRQIGEMQPFEFIVTLIIADLACVPMADVSIPLLYGVISIACLFLFHQVLTILEQKGKFLKKVISGRPSLVIDKNGIVLKELKKNDMSVDDLIESMRAGGYFALDDLSYAIYESNGQLSSFENQNQSQPPSSLPLLIVSDGKIDEGNCKKIGTDSERIKRFIKEQNGKLKEVEVMTVDGNGRTYFKKKNAKFEILFFPLKEGIKW